MKRLFDNVISVFVVVIVLFLLIPLPPFLLDVFLIINISLALIILLITMNIHEPLEFSIFPSLLLITTLFGTECLFHALDSVARRRCRSGHQGIR